MDTIIIVGVILVILVSAFAMLTKENKYKKNSKGRNKSKGKR